MIIDFHTHTFPDRIAPSVIPSLAKTGHINPFSDGTASGLRASMNEFSVDYSVILPVATSPRQIRGINDAALLINANTSETGLLSFGAIHPDYDGWEDELIHLSKLGFRGIKIHPVYQRVDIDDIRFLRILDKAAELKLLVLTHCGIDIGYPDFDHCFPAKIKRAVTEVPDVTLICAHMGGWRMWKESASCLADTNVYLDTSFSTGVLEDNGDSYHNLSYRTMLNQEEFLQMIESFGVSRILFGTDSPWADQGTCIRWMQNLPIPRTQKDAILGANARQLLCL